MDLSMLKGIDRVRLRPSAFFGYDDVRGAANAACAVLDEFITEAALGACRYLSVTRESDGSFLIETDGVFRQELDDAILRAFFTEIYPVHTEVVSPISRLNNHAALFGASPTDMPYQADSGIGLFVPAICVCKRMDFSTVQNLKERRFTVENGHWNTALRCNPLAEPNGTRVHFYLDPTVFRSTDVPLDALVAHLEAAAATVPGLFCTLHDSSNGIAQTICYPHGLSDAIRRYTAGAPVFESFAVLDAPKAAHVQLCLGFTDTTPAFQIYHHFRPLSGGGDHAELLKSTITAAVNRAFAPELNGRRLSFDDLAPFTAVMLSSHTAPDTTTWKNERRTALADRTITDLTAAALGSLDAFLDDHHHSIADRICRLSRLSDAT